MFSEDINDSVSKYGDEYNFLYSPLQKSLLTVPGMTVDLEEKFMHYAFFSTYHLMGYCLQRSSSTRKINSEEFYKDFLEIFFEEEEEPTLNFRISTNGEYEDLSYEREKIFILSEEEKERVKLVLYMILKKLEIFFPDFVEFPEEEEEDMM